MEVEIRCPCAAVTKTPTVSTSPAYSSGDAVGGLQTLEVAARTPGVISANGTGSSVSGTVVLQSVAVVETGSQKAALGIVLFDANPSASTINDNAALVIHADDIGKVVGYISIAAGDYTTVSTASIANKTAGLVVSCAENSTTLYAAVVTTGTPTYTSTAGLRFEYGFLQN